MEGEVRLWLVACRSWVETGVIGRECSAPGVDGERGENGRDIAGVIGVGVRVGERIPGFGNAGSAREGGAVRYCTPSLIDLGDIAVPSSSLSGMTVVSRTANRSSISKSFSTSTPSLSTSSTARSNSQRLSTSSTIFAGICRGGSCAASVRLIPPAGLGGTALLVLVGTGNGLGAAVGTGTRRLSVDVCNLPESRYGPENQATSNRPRGSMVPPG